MGSVVPPLTSFPPVGGTRGRRHVGHVASPGSSAPRFVSSAATMHRAWYLCPHGVVTAGSDGDAVEAVDGGGVSISPRHIAQHPSSARGVASRASSSRRVPTPGASRGGPRSRALRAVQEPPPDRASLRLGAVRRGGEERRVGRPQIRPAMAHARVPRRAVQRRVARPQVRPGGEGLRKTEPRPTRTGARPRRARRRA